MELKPYYDINIPCEHPDEPEPVDLAEFLDKNCHVILPDTHRISTDIDLLYVLLYDNGPGDEIDVYPYRYAERKLSFSPDQHDPKRLKSVGSGKDMNMGAMVSWEVQYNVSDGTMIARTWIEGVLNTEGEIRIRIRPEEKRACPI